MRPARRYKRSLDLPAKRGPSSSAGPRLNFHPARSTFLTTGLLQHVKRWTGIQRAITRSVWFFCVGTFFPLPPSRTGIVSRSRSVWFPACLTCSGRSYLCKRLLLSRSLFEGEDLTKDAVKSSGFLAAVKRTHLHIFTLPGAFKAPVKIEIHFQMCIPFFVCARKIKKKPLSLCSFPHRRE